MTVESAVDLLIKEARTVPPDSWLVTYGEWYTPLRRINRAGSIGYTFAGGEIWHTESENDAKEMAERMRPRLSRPAEVHHARAGDWLPQREDALEQLREA